MELPYQSFNVRRCPRKDIRFYTANFGMILSSFTKDGGDISVPRIVAVSPLVISAGQLTQLAVGFYRSRSHIAGLRNQGLAR